MNQFKHHADWYEDGVDGVEGPDKYLWRLDLPNVQIQLFAGVKDGSVDDEDLKCTGEFYVLIENDIRDPAGDKRIHYSCDDWSLTETDTRKLLLMSTDQVTTYLWHRIEHVRHMPNDPEMCEQPASVATESE